MTNFKYILIAVICVLTLSCKKSADFLYTDIARLQFGPAQQFLYLPSYAFNDSLKQETFVYLNTNTLLDTVYFDIYAMGNVTDKDRAFSLKQEQVNGQYNAIPGVHYKAFTDPDVAKNYVIKAGQAHSLLPVILIRDASLKTNSAVLKLNIIANENFQPGQSQLLWRKVVFTDRISRPAAWDDLSAKNWYGKYSSVKHKFMIDNTGQKWDQDFLTLIGQDIQQQQYWVGMVKTALAAYNKAHPGTPLTDELGDLILIP